MCGESEHVCVVRDLKKAGDMAQAGSFENRKTKCSAKALKSLIKVARETSSRKNSPAKVKFLQAHHHL